MTNKKNARLPSCPITGEPAKRRVQGIPVWLFKELWKYSGAGDVGHLFPASGQISLYESPCGLYFFEPRISGDSEFYARFYRSREVSRFRRAKSDERGEFQYALQFATPSMSILDVGCGDGVLGQFMTGDNYRGLDPYAGPDADPRVIRESLDEHLAQHAAHYDMVTAFHVIEHVVDPLAFAEKLVALLKPGGVLLLAAPMANSPLTEVPNFPSNAPPHHLTWWSCPAFAALAGKLGLQPLVLEAAAPADNERLIYWMHFLSMARSRSKGKECYFSHRWLWHLNLFFSYTLASLISRLLPLPRGARANNAVLVARKPQ